MVLCAGTMTGLQDVLGDGREEVEDRVVLPRSIRDVDDDLGSFHCLVQPFAGQRGDPEGRRRRDGQVPGVVQRGHDPGADQSPSANNDDPHDGSFRSYASPSTTRTTVLGTGPRSSHPASAVSSAATPAPSASASTWTPSAATR